MQEIATAGDSAANELLHEMSIDFEDINTKAAEGVIPRIGHVVTAFCARGVEDDYNMAADWDSTFDDIAELAGAIIHTTTNSTLPSIMVEYLPDMSSNTCGFRCPHRADRIFSETITYHNQTQLVKQLITIFTMKHYIKNDINLQTFVKDTVRKQKRGIRNDKDNGKHSR